MKTIPFPSRRILAASCVLLAPLSLARADAIELHPKAAAVAHLKSANSTDVVGTVQFIPETGGMRVLAHIMNLSPGEHGFHVHEHGDLSAPDLSSAGGHYNPTDEPHAAPHSARRHVGDLGNITASANGIATVDRLDSRIKLEGPHSIIGRAVIVHAKPDDFTSQPSGNAGDRVAGGIIQKVKR